MLKELFVIDKDTLIAGEKEYRCSVGIRGFTKDKREGDGKTPIGAFALRECYHRADRFDDPINTELTLKKITPVMGWCDAPHRAEYNTRVRIPFDASHEELWKEDLTYDIFIPLGYNDDPVESNKGSAIFFHLIDKDYGTTQGCIAIAKADMLELLPLLGPDTVMHIAPQSAA